jgi:hypothetical protein
MVYRAKLTVSLLIGSSFIALVLAMPAAAQSNSPASGPGSDPPATPAGRSSTTGAITQLTPACRAAKRYIDLASARRYKEIGDLFADKVDYVGPDARALSNREDIKKGYFAVAEAETKAGNPPGPRLKSLVPLNDNECFMEAERFDHVAAAYRLFSIDHFIVGPDGKVIWFRPYFQESSSHWHDDYVTAAGK